MPKLTADVEQTALISLEVQGRESVAQAVVSGTAALRHSGDDVQVSEDIPNQDKCAISRPFGSGGTAWPNP